MPKNKLKSQKQTQPLRQKQRQGQEQRSKFKNMLAPAVYREVFKTHFRVPRYGRTSKVPLALNAMQDEVIDNMDFLNIILKARKEGFSTLILSLAIVNCNEIPNYHGVFLADNDKNTKAIFRRANDILHNMPNFDISSIEITAERIIFKRTNSYIEIATAGRKSAFRGSDVHFAHLSEVAFFQYPEVYEAVLEAIAQGGIVFFESTANGMNMYQKLWSKAKTYPHGSAFKPFFFGWQLHPDNTITPPAGFKLTQEEAEYKAWAKDVHDIDLTDGNIAWKRHKLKSMPNPEKFPQEYPLSAEEAFISSGHSEFNKNKLALMIQTIPPHRKGLIDLNRRGELSWVDGKDEPWKVFELPQDGKEYLIGADTAEGVQDGDFDTAFVLDPETFVQVAEYHNRVDPDQFAYELNKGGRFYNHALLAVERNNHGYFVNSKLMTDYEYPRLYKEEKASDTMMTEVTMNCGFRTNPKTRPLMVDIAKRYIRKGLIKINSMECIHECLSFVRNPVGKPMHDVGAHDDRVFAMMIALYIADKYAGIRGLHGLSKRTRYHELVENVPPPTPSFDNRGGY